MFFYTVLGLLWSAFALLLGQVINGLRKLRLLAAANSPTWRRRQRDVDSGSIGGDRSQELSVVMFPDATDANPYQRELRTALEATGDSVEISGFGHYLPLFQGLWDRGTGEGQNSIRNGGEGWPDAVHIHWLSKCFVTERPWLTALLGVRLLVELAVLKMLGVTVVWTVHNRLEHRRRTPRVERVTKSLAVRLIDSLVVHCETAREAVYETFALSPRGRTDVVVVPHGHYIDSYPNEVPRTDARERFGYGPDETVLLFFGQIRPYKNVLTLIEAFCRLSNPGARLLVVGNPWTDDLAAAIKESANDNLGARAILEFVPEDDVQWYMNAADVVVFPYEVLTSGSVILAMSFGRPVIAPDTGCVGELLGPSDNLHCEPTVTSLSASMADALNAELKSIGAQNRSRVERLDWHAIARRTRQFYADD